MNNLFLIDTKDDIKECTNILFDCAVKLRNKGYKVIKISDGDELINVGCKFPISNCIKMVKEEGDDKEIALFVSSDQAIHHANLLIPSGHITPSEYANLITTIVNKK